MNDSKISVRYAKAFFNHALEKGILDNVMQDVKLIFTVSQTVPDFNILLQSPVIAQKKKQSVIKHTFGDSLNPATFEFLNLIIANKRETFIEQIARNFLTQFRELKGIKKAVITTAVPVSENTKRNIMQFVKNQYNSEVELEEIVDNKIVGGFVLRVNDLQIDASFSSKLKKIREKLIDTTYEKALM